MLDLAENRLESSWRALDRVVRVPLASPTVSLAWPGLLRDVTTVYVGTVTRLLVRVSGLDPSVLALAPAPARLLLSLASDSLVRIETDWVLGCLLIIIGGTPWLRDAPLVLGVCVDAPVVLGCDRWTARPLGPGCDWRSCWVRRRVRRAPPEATSYQSPSTVSTRSSNIADKRIVMP